MLDYRIEKLTASLVDEMESLFSLYFDDVAAPFHSFPPNVDWDLYAAVAKIGRLRIVVGRNEEGDVKAFGVVGTGPHPHYACITGNVPMLFLHPDYRKGYEGIRLVRLLEKAAEEAGSQIILTHGGMHNGVYRLFEGMHYQTFGMYYVKVLGNGPNGLTPVFKDNRKGELWDR
jgi:hypothetical protein